MADNATLVADKTLRAGLIGQGISRSLTPAMHMQEGRALGLDYSYDLIDTSRAPNQETPLPDLLKTAQDNGFAGLNITHPYKIEVLQYLDSLSDSVRRLGAVNTVVFQDGKMNGHNTDYSGFITSFKRDLGDAPKVHVLLLGAGGAGAAVGFGLLDCGVEKLSVHDVNNDQASALVRKLQANYPDAEICAVQGVDGRVMAGLSGVINATPMGMANYPGAALPLELLIPAIWVADIVYFPLETALLARARDIGCRLMPGSGMAVFQAVHAFELFTGQPADPDRMADTFKRLG